MARRDQLRILTTRGVRGVWVTSDAEASLLGRYWNAVRGFLGTGEEGMLIPFRRKRVAGVPLITDPDTIEYWAAQGQLDFDRMYIKRGGSA